MDSFPDSVIDKAIEALPDYLSPATTKDTKNLIIGPFVMSPVGLTVVPGMAVTFGEWDKAVDEIWGIKQAVQWTVGDIFNIGEDSFTEEYAQKIDSFRYTPETISNLMWISRRYPASERFSQLTHSHHVAVAGLAPDVARGLLKRAVAELLSSRDLRKMANAILHPKVDDGGEDDDEDDKAKTVTRELVNLDAPDTIMDFISADNMLMVTLPLSEDNVDDLRRAQKSGARLRVVIVEELES